jgi:hypothetical protein
MIAEFYESWRSIRKKARGNRSHEQARHFHENERPYVVIISDKNRPQYIVKMTFNKKGFYCGVLYLNENLDSELVEAYVLIGQQLFLKNVQKRYFDGREISLVTYLYEVDGRYRKNFFIGGKETDDVEYGTCDVSNHFREMIQFMNYDSILPEEARRGLSGG